MFKKLTASSTPIGKTTGGAATQIASHENEGGNLTEINLISKGTNDYDVDYIPRAIYNSQVDELLLREEGVSGRVRNKSNNAPPTPRFNAYMLSQSSTPNISRIHSRANSARSNLPLQIASGQLDSQDSYESYDSYDSYASNEPLSTIDLTQERQIVLTELGINIITPVYMLPIPPLPSAKIQNPSEEPAHIRGGGASRALPKVYPRTTRYATWKNTVAAAGGKTNDAVVSAATACAGMVSRDLVLAKGWTLRYKKPVVDVAVNVKVGGEFRKRGLSFRTRGVLERRAQEGLVRGMGVNAPVQTVYAETVAKDMVYDPETTIYLSSRTSGAASRIQSFVDDVAGRSSPVGSTGHQNRLRSKRESSLKVQAAAAAAAAASASEFKSPLFSRMSSGAIEIVNEPEEEEPPVPALPHSVPIHKIDAKDVIAPIDFLTEEVGAWAKSEPEPEIPPSHRTESKPEIQQVSQASLSIVEGSSIDATKKLTDSEEWLVNERKKMNRDWGRDSQSNSSKPNSTSASSEILKNPIAIIQEAKVTTMWEHLHEPVWDELPNPVSTSKSDAQEERVVQLSGLNEAPFPTPSIPARTEAEISKPIAQSKPIAVDIDVPNWGDEPNWGDVVVKKTPVSSEPVTLKSSEKMPENKSEDTASIKEVTKSKFSLEKLTTSAPSTQPVSNALPSGVTGSKSSISSSEKVPVSQKESFAQPGLASQIQAVTSSTNSINVNKSAPVSLVAKSNASIAASITSKETEKGPAKIGNALTTSSKESVNAKSLKSQKITSNSVPTEPDVELKSTISPRVSKTSVSEGIASRIINLKAKSQQGSVKSSIESLNRKKNILNDAAQQSNSPASLCEASKFDPPSLKSSLENIQYSATQSQSNLKKHSLTPATEKDSFDLSPIAKVPVAMSLKIETLEPPIPPSATKPTNSNPASPVAFSDSLISQKLIPQSQSLESKAPEAVKPQLLPKDASPSVNASNSVSIPAIAALLSSSSSTDASASVTTSQPSAPPQPDIHTHTQPQLQSQTPGSKVSPQPPPPPPQTRQKFMNAVQMMQFDQTQQQPQNSSTTAAAVASNVPTPEEIEKQSALDIWKTKPNVFHRTSNPGSTPGAVSEKASNNLDTAGGGSGTREVNSAKENSGIGGERNTTVVVEGKKIGGSGSSTLPRPETMTAKVTFEKQHCEVQVDNQGLACIDDKRRAAQFPILELRRIVKSEYIAGRPEVVVHACVQRDKGKSGSKFRTLEFHFDGGPSKAKEWAEGLMILVYGAVTPEKSVFRKVLCLVDKFEKEPMKLIEKYMKPVWTTIGKDVEIKCVQFTELSIGNSISEVEWHNVTNVVMTNQEFTPKMLQILVRNGYADGPLDLPVENDPVDAALAILKSSLGKTKSRIIHVTGFIPEREEGKIAGFFKGKAFK